MSANLKHAPFLLAVIATATTALLPCAPATADDTELFVGEAVTAPAGRPNILFILDTSGSMDADVVTQVPYDPNGDFGNAYDNNRIYYKRGSQSLPPCNADDADRDWNDDGTRDCDRSTYRQWIDKPKFVCNAASANLTTPGFAIVNKAAQWKNPSGSSNDKWDVLVSGVGNMWVECKDDAGVHGQAATGNTWAANKANGPWSSSSANKVDWNTTGEANVTFYTGHYLNWARSPTTSRTRLEIMQEAATNLLDSMANNVNVGLMRYSNDSSSNADGGMVMHPVEAIEDARAPMKALINGFQASGWTPLSETLYEAHQYYSGGNVVWGRTSDRFRPPDDSDTPSVGTACVSGSCTGSDAKYISPAAEESCQRNYIVFLTDGLPTRDVGSDSAIGSLIGRSCDVEPDSILEENGVGICTDDLARYMQENDILGTAGFQNITTYWVGLEIATGQAFLEQAAAAGGGKFYPASNSAELTQVFTEIISRILSESQTFTAPTVAVNAFNRTQNLNYLYMSLFKPSQRYRWEGNLKKYRIDQSGVLYDAAGNTAIDPATGFFKSGAKSYWSDVVDGADAELGGAAGELTDPDPTKRTIYTMFGAESGALTQELSALKLPANLATANELLFGVASGTALPDRPTDTVGLDGLIDWAYGYDVLDEDGDNDTTEARLSMGDPLHSRPAAVIYGGPENNPDLTLYATTNDGYLHAIDADDGTELWSFVPKEMLDRLEPLLENDDVAATGRVYGLDGTLEIVRIDRDGDGTIESSDGDHVYLYFGMRRGGFHYYALDVTNRSAPTLMWRIGRADSGISAGSSKELPGVGQTWSTPTFAKVNVRSGMTITARNVLIFGGGYDTGQDTIGYTEDGDGNRIFMVDALTGALIWRAGPTADTTAEFRHDRMLNAIPGEVRVIDLTGDGFADRMYAADLGGRVWRFDIRNGQEPDDLVMGGVFASLGTGDLSVRTGGTANTSNRRFFYAPDVALVTSGASNFLSVSIGSGHREKPITDTTVDNRFYSLRDHNVFTQVQSSQYKSTCGPSETSPCHQIITDGDTRLVDVTSTMTPTIPAGGAGWKMNLEDDAEKVLAESRTFQNRIYFTTYSPEEREYNPEICVSTVGLNRLYVVDVLTGKPVINWSSPTDPPDSLDDRFKELAQGSIAPEALFVFPTPYDADPDDGVTPPAVPPICLVGLESCGTGLLNPPVRTYWERTGSD